jgi:hypothetical protein
MTRVSRHARWFAAGVLLVSGCTSHGTTGTDRALPAGAVKLVAFDSCDDLLKGLRTAAKAAVGPYGFVGDVVPMATAGGTDAKSAGQPGARVDAAAPDKAPEGGTPDHSGTNSHEPGADEPDLVKTDGRRIVTISGGMLRVLDVASRRVTGTLDVSDGGRIWGGASASQLLLSGDRALVLIPGGYAPNQVGQRPPGVVTDRPIPAGNYGSQLLLVDLAGGPHLTGTYAVDGSLVDARQVGATVRVVVHSTPRVPFPVPEGGAGTTESQRIATNQTAIDNAPVDTWLPGYAVDDATGHHTGRVDCRAVSRPRVYSGASLLTVLTFDLTRSTLGTGDAVSIAADGQTVYSNGPSLYVANYADRYLPRMPVQTHTELYQFDISGSGAPRFVAAGSVQGFLLNQYSLSEWDGHLRVATTSAQPWQQASPGRTESAVYVLHAKGRDLLQGGYVGGLGRGERIYAVRFYGPTGYVVTFRQTDPLYTVDLSNPDNPTVVGELKINGYSAYLHPSEPGRLIGIGQDANTNGRVLGTQVSLFDVSKPANPTRLAQYAMRYGQSEAEFDPHAFLYWQPSRLLVVPLTVNGARAPIYTALALKIGDTSITQLGTVTHPVPTMIRRSIIIGDTQWTVSDAGLAADDSTTLTRLAWVAFA